MILNLSLKLVFVSVFSVAVSIVAYSQKHTPTVVVKQSDDLSETTVAKATRILMKITIEETSEQLKAKAIVASYFDSLHRVFTERKTAMEIAIAASANNKELAEARSKIAWDAATARINKLHATFLGKLSSILTANQIDQLKDEMTERGLEAEYNRFIQLLPNLTDQHKVQLIDYLKEARENAMDAETVDMRKQWFIKYRGRANNYLAAAGYDLRTATQMLEKRKKEFESN